MNPDAIKPFFEKGDRFARHCDIEVVDIAAGLAQCRMPIHDYHLNGLGVVQGGAIFTLADLAFACACNSHGTVAVAIDVDIQFMAGARPEHQWLIADAHEVTKNPRLSSCRVDVKAQDGTLIAVFQGLAYRKKDALPDIGQ